MKRRALCFMLVMAMLFGLFAACGVTVAPSAGEASASDAAEA